MRLARKQCTLYVRKKADAEAAATVRLRVFNEEHGKGQLTNIVAVGPTSRVVGGPFRTPCSLVPTSRAQPPVGEMAKQLVHFLHANGNTNNIRSALAAWWDGRHKFIEHARCPPIPPDVGGRKRKTFSRKFVATLKAFFARKSRAFDLLMTSSVYVVLQGRAHDVGVENDPGEERVWHITDVGPLLM